jgi:hypothetical protein
MNRRWLHYSSYQTFEVRERGVEIEGLESANMGLTGPFWRYFIAPHQRKRRRFK